MFQKQYKSETFQQKQNKMMKTERPEISRESPLGTWAIKANPSSKQIQLHSIPHTVNQARPASIVFGIYCYAMKTSIPQ